MNFLKKKLKPLTSGLTHNSISNTHNKNGKADKDLEDDLYDEYVVEAPPHPSELLALGVDPTDIDVNDPEKLKELYRKAKEEGKDKKTNSILLARQRQKEEIEEKKKTREEWKFFDSMTARVDQAVKNSQKTLEHLKEVSAIEKLTEPEYELRLTPDQVFKSSASVKSEKSANNWINFSEEESKTQTEPEAKAGECPVVDKYSCPGRETVQGFIAPNFIVEELLQDFGLDLRPAEQKKLSQLQVNSSTITKTEDTREESKSDLDLKTAARPRPRPRSNVEVQEADNSKKGNSDHIDPFDTTFVSKHTKEELDPFAKQEEKIDQQVPGRALDPFDTSFVNV